MKIESAVSNVWCKNKEKSFKNEIDFGARWRRSKDKFAPSTVEPNGGAV